MARRRTVAFRYAPSGKPIGWSGGWPVRAVTRNGRPAARAARSTVTWKSSAVIRLEHDAWTSVPPGSTSATASAVRRAYAATGRGDLGLAVGERRRVDDDHVEAPAGAGQVGHHREGVADHDVVARRRRAVGLRAMLRRAVASAGALWSTLSDRGRPAGCGVDREAHRCRRTRRARRRPPASGRPGPGCPAGPGSARSSGPARRRPRTTARPPGTAPARSAARRRAPRRRTPPRSRAGDAPEPEDDAFAQLRPGRPADDCANVRQPGRGVRLDDGRRVVDGRRRGPGSPSFSPWTQPVRVRAPIAGHHRPLRERGHRSARGTRRRRSGPGRRGGGSGPGSATSGRTARWRRSAGDRRTRRRGRPARRRGRPTSPTTSNTHGCPARIWRRASGVTRTAIRRAPATGRAGCGVSVPAPPARRRAAGRTRGSPRAPATRPR